jgi:glucose dehydrogenase
MSLSPDGARLFVTGTLVGSTGANDYATVAYDASTGSRIWVKRYGGAGYDVATALGMSPDGSTVFVTGAFGVGTRYDFVTVAYDTSTGAKLWAEQHRGATEGAAKALGVSPDGGTVFVTGTSATRSGSADYLTIAYDASTGAEVWASRFNGPADGTDAATALTISPDGSRIFVTGSIVGWGGGRDYDTLAYDTADGAKLWFARFSNLAAAGANAICVSPDGARVFVTGRSTGSSAADDYVTIAMRPDANLDPHGTPREVSQKWFTSPVPAPPSQ